MPYNIILEICDDGEEPYWVARLQNQAHCLIHGDTPGQAVREIEEVIERNWIKSNLERGLKIPEPILHKHMGKFGLESRRPFIDFCLLEQTRGKGKPEPIHDCSIGERSWFGIWCIQTK